MQNVRYAYVLFRNDAALVRDWVPGPTVKLNVLSDSSDLAVFSLEGGLAQFVPYSNWEARGAVLKGHGWVVT